MPDPVRVPPASDVEELSRIRATFERRDRRAASDPAFTRASLRLADDRLERMARLIASTSGLDRPRILDVGCGGGRDLAHWLGAGWAPGRLAGIDVVPERVEQARTACPGVEIRLGDSGPLPYEEASFAVVTASVVLSSILDDGIRRSLAASMLRIVQPGGLLLIYDFVIRNPRNPDVRPMPLRALVESVGSAPRGSMRISPLIHAVAMAEAIHPRLADLAMRMSPKTHRLTWWVRS